MSRVLAYVSASDTRVMGRLRLWLPPRWVRLWMIAASRLGDGWLWLGTAAALCLLGDRCHRALAAGGLAAALANTLQVSLKHGVRRARPCDLVGLFPHFDIRPPDRFSFPSGHSMNAFAFATVLALDFPALAPLLLLVASSIAASRLVLGLHYLSDVVAGALIGAASFLALAG